MKKILVIGGAGYIGSHVCVELLNADKDLIIVDDFSNSKPYVIKNIAKITEKKFDFYELDYSRIKKLEKIFLKNKIDLVINFTGLKSISESFKETLKYYKQNINYNLNLLRLMKKYDVKKYIFSSSVSVYDPNLDKVFDEEDKVSPKNPYSKSKYFLEEILADLYSSDNSFKIAILRYSNPIGNHSSGLIGEDSINSDSLVTNIIKVLEKKKEKFEIFGNYDTKDKTATRDFIDINDLTKVFPTLIKTLENPGINIYNLASGKQTSILEFIKTFEKLGVKIDYEFTKKRNGDFKKIEINNSKAKKELGLQINSSLEEICKSILEFVKNKNHKVK